MPRTTPRPAGAPCWIDLMTSDVGGALAFYGELFGWEFEDASNDEGGSYHLASLGGAVVAGVMAKQEAEFPDSWNVYLASSDIAATARRVEAAGGTIVVPVMQIDTSGSMMVVADPAGAVVSVWQSADFAGTELLAEHGTPIWFESLSKDYKRSLAFYRDAFDWELHTLSDTDQFRYTTLGESEVARAGIMDAASLAPEIPSMWQIYFASDDVDATAARLLALGGTEVTAAHDTPYGHLGAYTDPTGAFFCLSSIDS